ncbi:MAG: tripartite tricarboxylate transporter substrate binding protein [Syntrophales bacterium]|jgi:tripartite-type tricarboxylate transporter receptor subunit TctC|nr:tripartite tricarboxylate transporter substrate binding protein [Syntrophales bacterium]
MMQIRRAILFLAVAMISVSLAGGLCFGAEPYPTKPIQVIVPWAAGGSTDLLARTIEKFWTKYSPQPMVVINKPGAGGVMGEEFVIRSKPDGYTIYFGQGSGHDLVMPHLKKMPFDPLKDIAPVARISIHSVLVCVGGTSPMNSMKDLVAYANAGNKVTAAVSTAAGAVDIVMRAISKRANITITTVPFRGGAEAVTALAGGHLTIGGGHPSEVMPHIVAGRFKAIGVALPERDSALPNIPTLREQGIDVSTWGSVKGVAMPLGTPPEIIAYMSSTLKKITEDAEFKKAMVALYQPIEYLDSKEWAAFMKKASKDYGDLIKELGIKL